MNKYKRQLDALPFDPDFQEKTIRLMRENAPEKTPRSTKKIWQVGLIAAALILLTTVTTVAFNLLKSPDEVVDEIDRYLVESGIKSKYPEYYRASPSLADAFRSEDAVIINEEHEMGGLIVTLEGIATGEGVGGEIDGPDPFGRDTKEQSCVALAVRYKDGQPIESVAGGRLREPKTEAGKALFRLRVNLFVQGYDPCEDKEYRWAFPMEGGAGPGYPIDGVSYIFTTTKDLTHLPGKKIYVAVYVEPKNYYGSDICHDKETTPFTMNEDGTFILNERAEEIPATIFEVDLNGT